MGNKSYIQAGACIASLRVIEAFAQEATCPPGEEDSRLVVTPDGEITVLRDGKLGETIGSFTPTPDDFWNASRRAPAPAPAPEIR